MSLTLFLPLPPSTNTIWRHVNGIVKLSDPARKYRQTVQNLVLLERQMGRTLSVRATGLYLPLVGPLAIKLTLIPPTAGYRRDLDNCIKSVQDALTHAGVWRDDSQITRLQIERAQPSALGAAGAGIAVEIWPLEAGAQL